MTISLRPLPRGPKRRIVVFGDWLQERFGATRRPEAAAKLLVLVGLLYWQDKPEPLLVSGYRTRDDIARHLGIAVSSVDANLSLYQGRGLIRRRIEIIQGKVRQNPDRTIQCDYVDPCGDFIGLSLFGGST